MNVYYGPHLHISLKCLHAGNKNQAASWMAMDIAEEHDVDEYPHPESLKIIQAKSNIPFYSEHIEYETILEYNRGLFGDGI